MALDLLADLDPEQREVATQQGRPVCVIAGAGTGKTRAITHRIAYGISSGVIDPSRSLAVTFTSKAAAELRQRLLDLEVPEVPARTIHSAALRQLQYFWPKAETGELPRLVPSKAGYARVAAAELGIEEGVSDLISAVEWAKASLRGPDDLDEVPRGLAMPVEAFADFYRRYEAIKIADGAIDFEDLLLVMAGLIAEHDSVRQQVSEQYQHISIDEYQDISPLQQQLLELWIGDARDVCVVGDPHQTIYSFAGAHSGYLENFAKRHGANVIRLFRDYRSTPQVVEFANRLLPKDAHLVGQRAPGPAPAVLNVDGEEMVVIADQIGQWIAEGAPREEIAVLFRTNSQAETCASVLARRGIPAVVRRTESEQIDPSRVTVASLHAAKGLEWDRVILGGVVEGLIPISYAQTPEAIAEEKRLLYVGITRAREHLLLTYQGERSRFLDHSPVQTQVAAARAVTVAACRVCGRPLGSAEQRKRGRCESCPGEVDLDLLERLSLWRRETATRERMPEFIIATDASLSALAERKPRTLEELRDVTGPRTARAYGADLLQVIAASTPL